MITTLAESIAHLLVKKGWGEQEKFDIYRYGMEVIFSVLSTVFCVILCGAIFHMMKTTLLFYICFLVLRRYCGGFHAKSYLSCNLIFTVVLLLSLLFISKYESLSDKGLIVITLISFLSIVFFAPISHENKPLLESELKIYRKVAIAISGLLLLIVMFLMRFDKRTAVIISLSMLVTSVAMVVSVIKERRGKHER